MKAETEAVGQILDHHLAWGLMVVFFLKEFFLKIFFVVVEVVLSACVYAHHMCV